jgi:rhodanese-related sulfurtransferase
MNQQNIPQITADEVKKAIDEKADVIILDVRTPEEFNRDHINESINIPVDELINKISEIMPDKNKLIYVYCLSGSRSDFAVNMMKQLGYSNVFSMTSGLLMWRSKRYPLQ